MTLFKTKDGEDEMKLEDDDDAKMFYQRVQEVLHFGWVRASRPQD